MSEETETPADQDSISKCCGKPVAVGLGFYCTGCHGEVGSCDL